MKEMKIFLSLVLSLVSSVLLAQNITVNGIVTDASTGESIPSAAVQVKGTTVGVVADFDGNYKISAPADGILVFSSVGYTSVEVPIAGKTVQNVALEVDTQMLEETIVVAFGTSTKESFTGSAKVLTSETIAQRQVSSAVDALKGQVAGVQISSSTGSPADDGTTIRIRGFSSIQAGQSPLIVLDGIPYEGSISNINPADIESMSVLKDAASNALYGARGANGVIMITTKKAKGSNAVVTFDGKVGVNSRAVPDYNYIKSVPGYYETHYKALYNSYIAAGKTPDEAHLMANDNVAGPAASGGLAYQVYTVPEGQFFIGYDGKVNPEATLGRVDGDFYLTPDDWTKEVLSNAVRQEYNLSVSGGTDKAGFYASVGYLNNKGILKATDFERLTARIRADYQAKKWLKVGMNAAYTHSVGNLSSSDGEDNSSGNVFAATTQVAPIYPLYVRNADGSIKVDSNGYTVFDYGDKSNAGLERPSYTGTNAVGDHYLDVNRYDEHSLNGTAFAEVKFLKDFKFTFNAGTSISGDRETSLINAFYGSYAASNGILSKYHTRSYSYNLQQLLSWSHNFNGHNLDIMVGHENYVYNTEYLYASKTNMFSPNNLELSGAVKESGSDSYTSMYNTEGWFGRVQYDWNEKVFVSASYRRDASSRFHPDHRWGNFWSVGAAWIMSKENWFSSSWVNYLKLKASYGSQGNDAIGNFRYTDTYDIRNSAGSVSLVLNTKGAKDITWETNGNLNAGLEFGLWGDVITGSVEGFYRKTTDMLSWFTVPPSLGYSGYYANVGDMVNTGVEADLTANIIRTKNVKWSVNANVTWFKNEITKLADSRKTMTTPEGYKGYQSSGRFYGEGLPLYTYFMKQYAGVDKSSGVPMWYMDKEINGKTVKVPTTNYSEATDYLSGNPIPKAYGGFGTTLALYGFDLTVNFSYQIGGLVNDSGYSLSMASPSTSRLGSNFHADVLKAWTPENPDSNIPRWQYGDLHSASSSDRFLTDASYLDLQSINFGYTLPHKVTKKAGIDALRIYCACDNVWLWSQRQGFDPRISLTGTNNATHYSSVRTISGGLNITF